MSQPAYGRGYAQNAAENYERYFVPAIGAPVADDLVDAAAIRPGERVLDVACGTGIVTRLAQERVGSEGTVAGLDPNPGMLAVARQAASPKPPVDWYEAPAEAIPLPDQSFDVALCGMGLQFFSDKEAALGEIRRVLVRNGRLVANLPGPTPPPLEAMAESLTEHIGPDVAGFVHLVFSLHDPDEIQRLATAAGFNEAHAQSAPKHLELPRPQDFLWQYINSTPLAAFLSEVDDQRRAALTNDYAARCREFVKNGGMAGEVTMTTLTALK
ncbi:MAG TPA: methyltransferase domain-containing protein [Actinomycetota bacterium]|jgi:ubiquinone/menaquinone biosynthesis C-methylase UbiE|nr:methyltransferase domain-containing protein [Actinomycetota bacterium]